MIRTYAQCVHVLYMYVCTHTHNVHVYNTCVMYNIERARCRAIMQITAPPPPATPRPATVPGAAAYVYNLHILRARVKCLVDICKEEGPSRISPKPSPFSCASSTVISTSKYHYLLWKMWTFW